MWSIVGGAQVRKSATNNQFYVYVCKNLNYANGVYEPINEFYIVKELTKEEYSLVVDKINNTVSKTKKLFIRLYKPEIYGEQAK